MAYDRKYTKIEPQIRKIPLKDLYPNSEFSALSNLQVDTTDTGKKYQSLYTNSADIDKTQILLEYRGSINFRNYISLPQANRSDKQFLDSTAKRERGGPYVVETRDDELILKKRGFGKKPFISYLYGDPNGGELLEFKPQTKIRTRKGSGVGMGFGGWNPLDKSTFNGTTSTLDDGDPQLALANKMLNKYKQIQKIGGGQTINGVRPGGEFLPFINDINVDAKVDNAGVFTRRIRTVNITVDDQVTALEKAIGDFNTKKETTRKEMYNSMGINPEDAYSQASNARKNAELKSNPATATVWGNPDLTTGMVITILGTSKKYSGNYYVKKATHEISKSGYLVDLEMFRQGINIVPVDSNFISAKESGKPVNAAVGDKDPGEAVKKLPVVANPSKNPIQLAELPNTNRGGGF